MATATTTHCYSLCRIRLQPLSHTVAASVAYGCSLCRIRLQGVSELLLPDCHLLGEEALSGALGRLTLGCPSQLTVVDLGFCGRGLTPEVRPNSNPNPHPNPNPDPTLPLTLALALTLPLNLTLTLAGATRAAAAVGGGA